MFFDYTLYTKLGLTTITEFIVVIVFKNIIQNKSIMNNVINRINMNDPKFKKVKRNVGRKANSLAYMKFEDNFSPFRVSNLPIGSFYSVYRNKDGSFGIIRDFNFFGTEYMISFYIYRHYLEICFY